MKPGVRALGVAESYRDGRESSAESTLAGVVTRADRTVDGFVFGSCTVGGTDATETVVGLFDRLDRPDVRYLFVGAVAPAWYNVLDLPEVADATDRPVLAVTFEASDGLADALCEAFSGPELDTRLDTYRRQPPRHEVSVNDETVFVRSVGVEDDTAEDETPDERAAAVVRAFTPEGGRPEPLRVARLAARAADAGTDDAGD